MQEDTYLGKGNDPLSLNRYTYCHNEPIRFIDPSGHIEVTDSKYDNNTQAKLIALTSAYYATTNKEQRGKIADEAKAVREEGDKILKSKATEESTFYIPNQTNFYKDISSKLSDNTKYLDESEWKSSLNKINGTYNNKVTVDPIGTIILTQISSTTTICNQNINVKISDKHDRKNTHEVTISAEIDPIYLKNVKQNLEDNGYTLTAEYSTYDNNEKVVDGVMTVSQDYIQGIGFEYAKAYNWKIAKYEAGIGYVGIAITTLEILDKVEKDNIIESFGGDNLLVYRINDSELSGDGHLGIQNTITCKTVMLVTKKIENNDVVVGIVASGIIYVETKGTFTNTGLKYVIVDVMPEVFQKNPL